MRISLLEIRNVRNLEQVSLEPAGAVNWLVGENGSGKTSVLEAIHVLARGRSFRASNISSVIRDGQSSMAVVARCEQPDHRLGVERYAGGWRGRIDRQSTEKLSDFARAVPLVLIDPENHLLLEGAPVVRRSFLDWGLFHVEQCYLADWKRYSRLLRQRNAALRNGARPAMLAALENPMAGAAAKVEDLRRRYAARLAGEMRALQHMLAFRVPEIALEYRPSAENAADYLRRWSETRSRDQEQGFTRDGPHRGDLVVRSNGRVVGSRFSRGQMKLGALLLKLAQMRVSIESGLSPVLLLDDPVSELDTYHLDRFFEWIAEQSNQVWITAIQRPGRLPDDDGGRMFHVEQGKIQAMV